MDYKLMRNEIKIRIIQYSGNYPNAWCLYLDFNNKEDSDYLESRLGAFELHISLKDKNIVVLVVHSFNKPDVLPFTAKITDIQKRLIKSKCITHLAATHSNNVQLADNHIFQVVPKYQLD